MLLKSSYFSRCSFGAGWGGPKTNSKNFLSGTTSVGGGGRSLNRTKNQNCLNGDLIDLHTISPISNIDHLILSNKVKNHKLNRENNQKA